MSLRSALSSALPPKSVAEASVAEENESLAVGILGVVEVKPPKGIENAEGCKTRGNSWRSAGI